MNRLKRLTAKQILVIAFFATALLSFILGFFIHNALPVAQVNGEFISRGTFLRKLAVTNGQGVLEAMIAERLIAQSLDENKIEVTDKEIDAKIASMRKDLVLQKTTFEQLLVSTRQTLPQFKNELRTQLGVEKLLKKQITVSDKEISDYFVRNKIVRGKNAILRSQLLSIKDTIYRAKLRQAFLNWYQLQKGKAKVQYYTGMN
ncbi:MAG: SurA N-terminal domain-containing protein [Microgenomates group bacterium]